MQPTECEKMTCISLHRAINEMPLSKECCDCAEYTEYSVLEQNKITERIEIAFFELSRRALTTAKIEK